MIKLKKKLTAFIGQTFDRDVSFYTAFNEKYTLFISEQQKNIVICGHVRKFVMRYIIIRTLYLLDLAHKCLDKL